VLGPQEVQQEMAKPIVVAFDGVESSFEHAKLERSRLFGARRRLPLDQTGQPCIRFALTTDGLYLRQGDVTARGHFDNAGRASQRSQLVGLEVDEEIIAGFIEDNIK